MNKVNVMLEPLRVFLTQIGAILPRLALAVAVLIAGWLLAKVARFALVKALRAINFNVLTERAGMDGFLKQGGIESDTTDIFGVMVYWLVILAAACTVAVALAALARTRPGGGGWTGLRGAAAAAAVVVPLGLLVWYRTGPGSPGWAGLGLEVTRGGAAPPGRGVPAGRGASGVRPRRRRRARGSGGGEAGSVGRKRSRDSRL